eukprot:1844939-Rhodomonas_salina.1
MSWQSLKNTPIRFTTTIQWYKYRGTPRSESPIFHYNLNNSAVIEYGSGTERTKQKRGETTHNRTEALFWNSCHVQVTWPGQMDVTKCRNAPKWEKGPSPPSRTETLDCCAVQAPHIVCIESRNGRLQQVRCPKWDKLANDLGDDFELEDEDSKREWMSRFAPASQPSFAVACPREKPTREACEQATEQGIVEPFEDADGRYCRRSKRTSSTDPRRTRARAATCAGSWGWQKKKGQVPPVFEEAGAEVAEQDASGAPRGKEHADPTRGQSTATRPGGGGGGGGGMDMKELLQLPIMQQALTGDLVDPEQEYLAMLAKVEPYAPAMRCP